MAGYIRQSTFVDGDTITAALFNNEYNQLVNAFSNTSGHKHDGTTAEGPVIGLIGDAGETSPNNKVLIDTTNNYIEFYVEVSSAPVQQLYIADGAIIPVTDSDIDLGTTSLRFKDTYTDTVTTTGNVSIGGDLTVTGSATISGNLTFGDADTDSINLAAEIDSDIIPNTDGTYDLGSATKEWQDLYIDGTANIDSLVADTADINGGTIDGATIATSDITVGSGKTLDVSSGTLTLADDQISGDKVEGGTIAATTVTTLTSTTGNITNVNATTLDTTNIEVTNLKSKDGTSAGSIADSTGVVTLASSVLTTTDINGGTIDGVTIATSDITVGTGKTLDVSSGTLTLADNQISGDKVEGGTIAATTITDLTFGSLNDGTITITAFVDEDDMSSDSATLLPTQQSVKAYVDSQVTAQDLDFQGDTGGALSIDLDSESLTIAGGTGIDTSGATNTLTVAIDSTVATLTGTQTLTNKTLTTPIISSISNTGTLTLPTSTDTLVGRATTDTLTNKTLTSATLTSPVINTGVSGTAFLDDDTFATATASTLASSESIKAYVDTTVAATNEVVEDSTPQLGGDLDTNGNDILFGDNDKAVFGAGNDLEIYHEPNNSIIKESGGGSLLIQGDNIRLQKVDGSENMLTAVNDGQLKLFYDGAEKLATTSTGIDVTGTVVADGLTVDGNGSLLTFDNGSNPATISNTNGNITTDFDTSNAGRNYTIQANSINAFRIANGGDISFYDDTGTSQALYWDASAESLGIGTTSPSTALDVTGTITADGLTVDGDITVSDATPSLTLSDTGGTNQKFVVSHNGATSYLTFRNGTNYGALQFLADNGTANVTRQSISSGGDISFYEDTGTTAKFFWDASAESLTVGGTGDDGYNLNVESAADTSLSVFSSTNPSRAVISTHSGNEMRLESRGGGAASILTMYTGAIGSPTERLRIDSSGNVGIGTSSPSQLLELSSDNSSSVGNVLRFNDSDTAVAGGQTTGRIEFAENDGANTTVSAFLEVETVGTSGGGVMTFGTGAAGSTATEAMRIDSSGNVGIGTDSPLGKLSIQEGSSGGSANANADGLVIDNNAKTGLTILTPNNSEGLIFFADPDDDNIGRITYNHSTNDMTFVTNNSTALTIDSSGNVGIGTTSPVTDLDVRNNISMGDGTSVTQLSMTRNSANYIAATNASGYLVFRTGGANERMRIDSSGNVGIGTTSPARVLHTTGDLVRFDNSGTAGIMLLDTLNNEGFRILTNKDSGAFSIEDMGTATSGAGTERMRIDSSGNLLVGRTSSVGKVDIESSKGTQLYINGLTGVSNFILFDFNGSTVGSITTNGVTTAYNTSSDARLKDVTGEARGLEVINELNPVSYNWKADGKADEGLIAQEVKEIVPNAVTGSEEDYYQMDYSKLVVHLVKGMKEQQTQIEALQSEINKLKTGE